MFPERLISRSNAMWRPRSPLTGCDKRARHLCGPLPNPTTLVYPGEKHRAGPDWRAFSKPLRCAPSMAQLSKTSSDGQAPWD